MAEAQKFFLFIGNSFSDAAVSKLKTTGVHYRIKKLESGRDNWEKIIDLLCDPNLKGVIIKLTGYNYLQIKEDRDDSLATRLFEKLGALPHVAFAHEAVLLGDREAPSDEAQPGDDDYDYEYADRAEFFRLYFHNPSDEERIYVSNFLHKYGISPIPYKTNAEMSVMSTGFIDDHEKNLLFRIYVPSGRLYADEADRLLSLFRDWLARVAKHPVRQDGYHTDAGRVLEFYGDDSLTQPELNHEMQDFSSFLTLCMEDPGEAVSSLSAHVQDRRSAEELVQRYGKEGRRLRLDLEQQRESRILSIRHQIQDDLLELPEYRQIPAQRIGEIVDSLLPTPGSTSPFELIASTRDGSSGAAVTINLNQQLVHAIDSTVLQNVQGTVHLGAEARDILGLVESLAVSPQEARDLESAVHELEDDNARAEDRLTAKQRLRAFLGRVANMAEGVTVSALQKYLESKLGI